MSPRALLTRDSRHLRKLVQALPDATRIQSVSMLARQGIPMSVGEIVAAVDHGQSIRIVPRLAKHSPEEHHCERRQQHRRYR
jgi:hypothetical protein